VSKNRLLSWGNYPAFPQIPIACHWRVDLEAVFRALRERHGSTLVYGSGRSYGDSCLAASDHVLHTRTLDRFLSADWSAGVLTAECGVTLEAILAVAVPRGWFLSVTPGTKYVTLGGAIANDVHGKNHHRRGTFGCHVRRFGLLRSDSGRITCSPDENAALFNATIGGLGLTGIIEWAEIQLMPIRSSQIDSVSQRFGNLDEFFALSDELDEQHEFCVSWIDCTADGKSIGRGLYVAGDFSDTGPLEVESTRKLTIPFSLPTPLIGGASVRAFNEFYWRKAAASRLHTSSGYDRFFYPLDAICMWNRIYGRRGFQQYQALIPEAEAEAGVRALLSAIAQSRTGSFLAVLKRCGEIMSPGLLSFPGPGTTLALDFPQSTSLTVSLFPRLDAIVREVGGRIYPAKDAHIDGKDFRRGYPAWKMIEAARDPALMSRFWKRVTQ
jgi:FAD/FMN-containing dehydrogenase